MGVDCLRKNICLGKNISVLYKFHNCLRQAAALCQRRCSVLHMLSKSSCSVVLDQLWCCPRKAAVLSQTSKGVIPDMQQCCPRHTAVLSQIWCSVDVLSYSQAIMLSKTINSFVLDSVGTVKLQCCPSLFSVLFQTSCSIVLYKLHCCPRQAAVLSQPICSFVLNKLQYCPVVTDLA